MRTEIRGHARQHVRRGAAEWRWYGTHQRTLVVSVNASWEVANGTWKLRVDHNAAAGPGKINSWALQFWSQF
ncbi:proprotein convertase P-domain-containing protein [Streptomyces sp. NPDC058092]|uniref:proprotein convertase P-domain-containing protein n=1 Tax=Streptomyces sp. NPDC058092 TaxID=3346336 RepID=UPI0036F11956